MLLHVARAKPATVGPPASRGGRGSGIGSSPALIRLTIRAARRRASSAEPPVFGQQGYTFELAENADGSTDRVSLGTVSATDPENAVVSYSFVGGNGSGSFEIDASSGELFYTGSGEDYESATTQFDLTVRASDGDQMTDTTVTVSVTDVDEPVVVDPPVEQPPESAPQTVSEPAEEDFSADTSTSGQVAVDETATGNIGSKANATGSRSSWWRAGPTPSI